MNLRKYLAISLPWIACVASALCVVAAGVFGLKDVHSGRAVDLIPFFFWLSLAFCSFACGPIPPEAAKGLWPDEGRDDAPSMRTTE